MSSNSNLGWAVDSPWHSPSPWHKNIFQGRVLVISGGGSGIGFGICKAFGELGCKIAMCGRRKTVLNKAVEELKASNVEAVGFQCDVRDATSCVSFAENVVEKFGKIDFLVNNAAGNFVTSMENLSSNGFKTVMEIDLHGSFNMAKAVLPHLKNNDGGVIVSISATLYYTAMPFQMHASAAKAAIDVMTNNIGVEWGEYGIRAVSIAPGPINNTVGGPTGRVFGGLGTGNTGNRVDSPTGRYGEVRDIANAAVFVCSSAGSNISSTTIVVDGGHWHHASGFYSSNKDLIQQISSKEKKSHKGGDSKL